MTTIVLWDIDNTLLFTGGAGSLAMARAFRDLYDVEDALRRVEFSGRADIEAHFPGVQGGFGEDSAERDQVIRVGI